MSVQAVKKIIDHPDKDEIISKLVIGISPKDIYDWLKGKYTNANETKFVISEKSLANFRDKYLDIYNHIKEDILKTQQVAGTDKQIELAVRGNKSYKEKILELADKKIDVEGIIINSIKAIEDRLAQMYDAIQQDPSSFKEDRKMMEWFDTLGNAIEKYYKYVEKVPDQIIQQNITHQVVDQHINVFYEVIREVLSQVDTETSLYFLEVYSQKMAKLKESSPEKAANIDLQLAEAKILSETIHQRLNE